MIDRKFSYLKVKSQKTEANKFKVYNEHKVSHTSMNEFLEKWNFHVAVQAKLISKAHVLPMGYCGDNFRGAV